VAGRRRRRRRRRGGLEAVLCNDGAKRV